MVKSSTLAAQPERAISQRGTVAFAEHRQQDAMAQFCFRRIPVDIEVGGISAGRAVLQHVPPPCVLTPADRHMVGHDVEQMAETVRAQGCAQARMRRLTAELSIDLVRINHIVTMCAAGRGLQRGRRIEVAHSESGEILGDTRRIVEPEPGMQLDAVCGAPRGLRPIAAWRAKGRGVGRGASSCDMLIWRSF